jgi:hypothetical protein
MKPNAKRPVFSFAFISIYLFTLLASVVCSNSVINFMHACNVSNEEKLKQNRKN